MSPYEHPIPTAREQGRLWSLLGKLERHGLDLRLKPHGLEVHDPRGEGCCDDSPEPGDTITCKERPDDDDRLWFFTSWGEPIEEADHIDDAVLRIVGYLRPMEDA